MKPTFLQYAKPLLTAMVLERTPEDAINMVMNAHYDGAEAFCFQMEYFEQEYHSYDHLARIFETCMGKPIYITSYRGLSNLGKTDEECVEFLLTGLKAGATLCDVMGDLYAPAPYQMTWDEEAIKRQTELIDQIHALGGEALISCHTQAFLGEEELMRIAREQKHRGADIVKIVNRTDSRAEMETDFSVICRLHKELGDTRLLLLANGPYCRPLRQLGPSFGVCTYLCAPVYKPGYSREQPILRAMKSKHIPWLVLKNRDSALSPDRQNPSMAPFSAVWMLWCL